MKKIHKTIIVVASCIIGATAVALVLVFLIISIIINQGVTHECQLAQTKYDGDCVESLMSLIADESNQNGKNQAIWALGQLGDKRALPFLQQYVTGQIVRGREPWNVGISQHELNKAIHLLQGSPNITLFFRPKQDKLRDKHGPGSPITEKNKQPLENTSLNQAVEQYLLSQKDFSWQTVDNSCRICMFEKLDPNSQLFPLYVWVRCSEFTFENGEPKEQSGISIPTKIDYPNELSFYDQSKFTHTIPRDGSLYTEDIKTIFPSNLQKTAITYEATSLNQKIDNAVKDRCAQ